MPQMMPMNWMLIPILFIITISFLGINLNFKYFFQDFKIPMLKILSKKFWKW